MLCSRENKRWISRIPYLLSIILFEIKSLNQEFKVSSLIVIIMATSGARAATVSAEDHNCASLARPLRT